MMGKYCCESMQIAVEEWGGVYWDEDKKCWMGEFERGGESTLDVIKICTWCHAILMPKGERSEMMGKIIKYYKQFEECPDCGSDALENAEEHYEDDTFTLTVECLECDNTWKEVYAFQHTEVEIPEREL